MPFSRVWIKHTRSSDLLVDLGEDYVAQISLSLLLGFFTIIMREDMAVEGTTRSINKLERDIKAVHHVGWCFVEIDVVD